MKRDYSAFFAPLLLLLVGSLGLELWSRPHRAKQTTLAPAVAAALPVKPTAPLPSALKSDCTKRFARARVDAFKTFDVKGMGSLLAKVSTVLTAPEAQEIGRMHLILNREGISDDLRLQALDGVRGIYNRAIDRAGLKSMIPEGTFAHPLYMSFEGSGWTGVIHRLTDGHLEPGIGTDVFLAANPDQSRYRVFFTRLKSRIPDQKETYSLMSLSQYLRSKVPSKCRFAADLVEAESFDEFAGPGIDPLSG